MRIWTVERGAKEYSAVQRRGRERGWRLSSVCSFILSISKPLLSSCSGSRTIQATGTAETPYVLQ